MRGGARKKQRKTEAAAAEGAQTTAPAVTDRPVRQRRSFSQSNLEQRAEGPLAEVLTEALTVPQDSGYRLTHAFHPYPGRFHPTLPRKVLRALLPAEATSRESSGGGKGLLLDWPVLDPFMGGGTTLVEALQLGLPAVGNDLNPVAVMVTRERTRPRTQAQAKTVNAEARRIAAAVEALRREKNPPRVVLPHPQRLMPHYQRHLLAELMQWLRLIDAVAPGPLRETLRAVFSSAVVKFSNLSSDSRPDTVSPPRYPKGAVSRFLVDKCQELTDAQFMISGRIPPGTPGAVLHQEDARAMKSLAAGSAAIVVTSPPYPGTYDYHQHHRLRMDWLGLDGSALLRGEVGARRMMALGKASGAEAAYGGDQNTTGGGAESWSAGLREVFVELARVVRPGGHLLLVMGDWISENHAVDALAILERTADSEDWSLSSSASLRRAEHSRLEKKAFGRRGKWEHLLHFTRSGEIPAKAPPAKTPVPKTGKRIPAKTASQKAGRPRSKPPGAPKSRRD